MKRITVDYVMDLKPCRWYTHRRVKKLWAGRSYITIHGIDNLPIPDGDKYWLLRHYCHKESNQRLGAYGSVYFVSVDGKCRNFKSRKAFMRYVVKNLRRLEKIPVIQKITDWTFSTDNG